MDDFFKTKIIFILGLFTIWLPLGPIIIAKLDWMTIFLFGMEVNTENIYYIVLVFLILSLFCYAFIFINKVNFSFFRKIGDIFYLFIPFIPIIFSLIYIIQNIRIPISIELNTRLFVTLLVLIMIIIMGLLTFFSSKKIKKLIVKISNTSSDKILRTKDISDHQYYNIIKRVIDIFISIIMLFITFPIIIISAIAIKLDSKGPIFFYHEKCGFKGKSFKIIKFRTMIDDAIMVGPELTQRIDPRVTRIGKILRLTSIDEIPKIINVLRGELSIIGPIPINQSIYRHFTPEQKLISLSKPGLISLTSLVRFSYFNHISNNIKYDYYYTFNKSIMLDLMILFSSYKQILFSYHYESALSK